MWLPCDRDNDTDKIFEQRKAAEVTIKNKFNISKQAERHVDVYKKVINSIRISSGGVLFIKHIDSIKYYLCKHSSGAYVFPKGGVFLGETLVECAVREVKEETGYTVGNPVFSLRNVAYSMLSKENLEIEKSVYFFAFEIFDSKKHPLKLDDGENIVGGDWYSEEECLGIITYKSEWDKFLILVNLLKKNDHRLK